MSQADTVSSIPHFIEKDMVQESISKTKRGKAAGPSGVVPKMVNVAGEAGVDVITCLVNQIIVGVIPERWNPGTILECYKGKEDYFKKRNYKGLKLTDLLLKITEKII